jgi:hypothetical protein
MRRIAVAALTVVVSVTGPTCGGTNGLEDIPGASGGSTDGASRNAVSDATLAESGPDAAPADSGVDATLSESDGGADATLADDSEYTGTFDVVILYADRVLPDVVAPSASASDGGVEAAYPWPADCPAFVPVIKDRPTEAGQETDEIPGTYDDAGNLILDDAGRVVPPPDGSACGSYGWLGSTAIDSCVTQGGILTNGAMSGGVIFPPCNWCIGAGNNNGGSRKGDPKYDTCLDLYACLRRTACGWATGEVADCLCGDASLNACTGAGPCGAEELAALESASDPASIQTTLTRGYTNTSPVVPGYCGGILNQVFQIALQNSCFPADAGPF